MSTIPPDPAQQQLAAITESMSRMGTAALQAFDALTVWWQALPPWFRAIYEDPPAPKAQRRQWRNHPQRRKHRH